MKKIILFILIACVLCGAVSGCGSKDSAGDDSSADADIKDAEEQQTLDAPDAQENGDDIDATESSDISGSFVREDGCARLMFYSESGIWFVEGDAQTRNPETCKMNTGSISGNIDGEGTKYYFDDGEAQAEFEFSEDSSILNVKTESTDAFGGEDFSGVYRLYSGEEVLNRYDLESAGYMAAAMYLAGKDESADYHYSPGETENEFAVKVIENYTELYFGSAAEAAEPDNSKKKYYMFDENYLNILLNTAFSETFGTDKLNTDNSEIIYDEQMYYIPCYERVQGDVSFEYAPMSEGEVLYNVTLTADGEAYEKTLLVTIAQGSGENNFTITEISVV